MCIRDRYAVRPWLLHPVSHASDLIHARTLVNLYSQNPSAYLTLEDDTLLYFGHKVDGVIPYGVVGSTIVKMCIRDRLCPWLSLLDAVSAFVF